ncbi:hypothetical protein HMPREF1548_04681 [Clostridium sp. KLE 1755]|nr:hypothetical protein HMPREF1548_04681 [Clostridium sp. KLE 1755]
MSGVFCNCPHPARVPAAAVLCLQGPGRRRTVTFFMFRFLFKTGKDYISGKICGNID